MSTNTFSKTNNLSDYFKKCTNKISDSSATTEVKIQPQEEYPQVQHINNNDDNINNKRRSIKQMCSNFKSKLNPGIKLISLWICLLVTLFGCFICIVRIADYQINKAKIELKNIDNLHKFDLNDAKDVEDWLNNTQDVLTAYLNSQINQTDSTQVQSFINWLEKSHNESLTWLKSLWVDTNNEYLFFQLKWPNATEIIDSIQQFAKNYGSKIDKVQKHLLKQSKQHNTVNVKTTSPSELHNATTEILEDTVNSRQYQIVATTNSSQIVDYSERTAALTDEETPNEKSN